MKTIKQPFMILATVMLLLISGNLFAQKKQPKFGIKGGPLIARIISDLNGADVDTKSKFGFGVFAFYDFYNSKTITLSAEVGFDQKGYEIDLTDTNSTGAVVNTSNLKDNLNYLDISGNFKYITRGESASPYFSLTPTLGVYLGHSSSGTVTGDSVYTNYKANAYDSLNSISFSVKIGLGVELYKLINNVPIIFEARYNPDLTQAYNTNNYNIRNSTVEFNLGVKF
ncbi:MAG: porin family protein [Ignavibacteria bacterium]